MSASSFDLADSDFSLARSSSDASFSHVEDAGVSIVESGFRLASDTDTDEAAASMGDASARSSGVCIGFDEGSSEARGADSTTFDALSFSSEDSGTCCAHAFQDGSGPSVASAVDPQILLRWPHLLLLALEQTLTPAVLRKSLLLVQCLEFTSHFSGIGTAEVAIHMLNPAIRSTLGLQVRWSCLSCYEKDPDCRRTLCRRLPHTCIFGDIADYCPVLSELLTKSTLNTDSALLQLRQGFSLGSGACTQHHQFCKHRVGHCDVSGSPCQPWYCINKPFS